MAEGSLEAAIVTVTVSWAIDGVLAEQTLDFGSVAHRFGRFAHAHGVTALADVDHALVAKFVAGKERARPGGISAAAIANMHNRRATLRAFFRTARQLQLTVDDPTVGITVPTRQSSPQRPLTDDEAVLVRLFGQRSTPTRHAATAALLLAGAHTSELGHITAADFDHQAGTVWAHGSARHRPRSIVLDSWSTRVLAERATHLTRRLARSGPAPVLCTGADGSDAHKQARVCVTVRDILVRAGLSDDPSIKPTSLTAHAARRAFERSGRVEDAARLIGSVSLDSTTALIGYHWQIDR